MKLLSIRTMLTAVLPAALIASSHHVASAQGSDSVARRPAGPPFAGIVASIRTTLPVPLADVRLMWVDSIHVDSAKSAQPELFVDSARSRIAITDSAGAFVVRNLAPGHYLINVRHIGFSPFEGMLTMDTLPIQMELALEQVMTVLPPVRITAGATNRVTERLEHVGFASRSRTGLAARYITRQAILDGKAERLSQVFERLGLSRTDMFMMDNIMMDWDEVRDYPIDLIVGIEVYPRSEMLPVELSLTRRGRMQLSGPPGAPLKTAFVVIWTYIP